MKLSKIFAAKPLSMAAVVVFLVAGQTHQAKAQPIFPGPYSQLTLNVVFTNAVGSAPVSVNDIGTIDLYSPASATNSSPWPHQVENWEVIAHQRFGSVDTILPFIALALDGTSQDGWTAGTIEGPGYTTIDFWGPTNLFASDPITYESTARDLAAHFSSFQGVGWLVGGDDPNTMEDETFVANFIITSAAYIPDVTSVPEPSVFSFGLIGAGLMVWFRRTRYQMPVSRT